MRARHFSSDNQEARHGESGIEDLLFETLERDIDDISVVLVADRLGALAWTFTKRAWRVPSPARAVSNTSGPTLRPWTSNSLTISSRS